MLLVVVLPFMSITLTSPEFMTQTTHPNSFRGEHFSSRSAIESLAKEVVFSEAFVTTSLPRGGLQIIQPQKISEALRKSYQRDFQSKDDASWKAITTQKAVRAATEGQYTQEFLSAFGYAFAAAVPLSSPVFEGYAGAIQILRTAEQGPFTDADLRKLTDAAHGIDSANRSARVSRTTAENHEAVWLNRPAIRQVVLDAEGKIVEFASAFEELDERIRQQMVQEARQRLGSLNGEAVRSDRILLPDSAGDQWTFNAVSYRQYPALSSGPVVFFCLQPMCPEWSQIRPGDFQADLELTRLIPAVKFMQEEYHRSPTLIEIARTVHLSPFHFHRRFTELLGLTPKHFLLECQIHEAKAQLLSGDKELTRIAADCGFAHQSHFTSRFKQATGLTPTRWRRMATGRNENGHSAEE